MARVLPVLLVVATACSATPRDAGSDPSPGPGAAPPPASATIDPGAVTAPKPPPPPPLDPMTLRPLYTEHLGQLTKSDVLAAVGMRGTDLGSTFERDGQIVALFGDTLAIDPTNEDKDSVATLPLAMPPTVLPPVTFFKNASGGFLPLVLPGIDLGAYNVPVEGVAVGPTTYVFFSTGYDPTQKNYGHSTLAHTTGVAFDKLVVDHDVATDKFTNVSVVQDGDRAWIFGSARYRASAVYVAKVKTATIADRSTWSYGTGPTPDIHAPGDFSPEESLALPVVSTTCVGELSVRKHPKLPIYVMTYSCETIRGIYMHLATSPEGPWTAPIPIFSPTDHGYGNFLHQKVSDVGYDDGLSDEGVEENWGGDYAAYLVPSYFGDDGEAYSIVYTLSSWNPYKVHLMRTVLGPPGVHRDRPNRGVGLPASKLVNGDFATGDFTGWTATGDAFALFVGTDGHQRVTTEAAKGDATVGTLSQSFVVDGTTSEIDFYVHGGDAHVVLRRGDEIVRSVHGRRTNDPELAVRWNVEDFRGDTLTISIVDDLTASWGFVGARDFTLK